MRTLMLIPAALSLLYVTGCDGGAGGDAEAYRAVLPDDRVLVNLNTEGASQARTGEWSEYYLLTAEVTDSVNGVASSVLEMVDAVTQTEPSWGAVAPDGNEDGIDAVALWGPYDGDALEPTATQLVVVHYTDDTWAWVIQQRPKADEAAEFTDIIGGAVEAGATEEASRGAIAIDFTAAHGLNPNSDPTQGEFFLTYDVGATGVSAEAAFAEFLDENGNPSNALYAYEQTFEGDGAMDLALETDLDTTTSARELLIVRSRWVATGAGRSDVYAIGGDLGDFVGQASDCWGADFQTSYWTDNFTDGGLTEGDEATCAFATAEYDEQTLAEAQP